MAANSAKELLKQYKKRQYRKFTLNEDQNVHLPVVSDVPWIGISTKRVDFFEKISIPPDNDHQVRFIKKNGKPHTFLWKTDAKKLKEGVRWGVVRTESITGKVISSLGRYRIIEHERVAKGMISNTHAIKLALLDHYQDRFEALQGVESLVNSNSSVEEFQVAFRSYIQRLQEINCFLDSQFLECNIAAVDTSALEQISADLKNDIRRAESYINSVTNESLRAHNRARGYRSVLEFVKQQMTYNLYELQGINQDLTYSSRRRFALTRGTLNDCIEDARRDINDHRADPRNRVTAKHHGAYGINDSSVISYDFSADGLSPENERQALLAISFIEGWDEIKTNQEDQLIVENTSGRERLSVISATNWKSHRNFITFLKRTWYYGLTIIKSFFVSTIPWEEEAWSKNSEFHLVAKSLRQHARPSEPLWSKPFHFIKQIFHAVVDVFLGIRDITSEFVMDMPLEILNDWASTKELPDFVTVCQRIQAEIGEIKQEEEKRLKAMLDNFPPSTMRGNFYHPDQSTKPTSTLAQAEYHLTAGETNDLLNSIVRGLDGFFSLFTHEIFAKDPVAGLLFTSAYLIGAGVIFLPALSTTIFGAAYVNWFTKFSYAMGSSKVAAVIAGGSVQAQAAATVWDTMMHGPQGMIVNFAEHVLEDPITVAAYLGVAYGIGYVLVNGVPGHPIPWLSRVLREDLGTIPETNYPFVGGKLAIILWEMLESHKTHPYHMPEMEFDGTEINLELLESNADYQKIAQRYSLIFWLATNTEHLPKLSHRSLHDISRQINSLFNREEAASLKKILYPEKEHSIAHQLFAIPLGYIPALCRFALSFPISFVALVNGNPHPSAAIKEAGMALVMRTKKDLSRIVIAATAFLYFLSKIATSFMKIVVFPAMMLLGRFAGLFRWNPGHALHKAIATFHVLGNKIGEFFYPASLTKAVVFANPIHTISMTEKSYVTLLQAFNITKDDLRSSETEEDAFSDESEEEKATTTVAVHQTGDDGSLSGSDGGRIESEESDDSDDPDIVTTLYGADGSSFSQNVGTVILS